MMRKKKKDKKGDIRTREVTDEITSDVEEEADKGSRENQPFQPNSKPLPKPKSGDSTERFAIFNENSNHILISILYLLALFCNIFVIAYFRGDTEFGLGNTPIHPLFRARYTSAFDACVSDLSSLFLCQRPRLWQQITKSVRFNLRYSDSVLCQTFISHESNAAALDSILTKVAICLDTSPIHFSEDSKSQTPDQLTDHIRSSLSRTSSEFVIFHNSTNFSHPLPILFHSICDPDYTPYPHSHFYFTLLTSESITDQPSKPEMAKLVEKALLEAWSNSQYKEEEAIASIVRITPVVYFIENENDNTCSLNKDSNSKTREVLALGKTPIPPIFRAPIPLLFRARNTSAFDTCVSEISSLFPCQRPRLWQQITKSVRYNLRYSDSVLCQTFITHESNAAALDSILTKVAACLDTSPIHFSEDSKSQTPDQLTDRIRSNLSSTSSEFVIFLNSTNFSHPLPILFHSICDPDYTPYPHSHFYFTLLTSESITKEAIASIVRITPVVYFIENEDNNTCLFNKDSNSKTREELELRNTPIPPIFRAPIPPLFRARNTSAFDTCVSEISSLFPCQRPRLWQQITKSVRFNLRYSDSVLCQTFITHESNAAALDSILTKVAACLDTSPINFSEDFKSQTPDQLTDRIRSSLSRTSSEFVIFLNSTNFSHPLPILFHSICDPDYTPYPHSHFYFTLLTSESITKEAIASIVRITPVVYFIENEDNNTCLFNKDSNSKTREELELRNTPIPPIFRAPIPPLFRARNTSAFDTCVSEISSLFPCQTPRLWQQITKSVRFNLKNSYSVLCQTFITHESNAAALDSILTKVAACLDTSPIHFSEDSKSQTPDQLTDHIRSNLSRTSSEFVIFHNSTDFSYPLPILFHSICDPDYTPYRHSHFYFTLLTSESITKEAIASIVRITPVVYFIENEDNNTCLFNKDSNSKTREELELRNTPIPPIFRAPIPPLFRARNTSAFDTCVSEISSLFPCQRPRLWQQITKSVRFNLRYSDSVLCQTFITHESNAAALDSILTKVAACLDTSPIHFSEDSKSQTPDQLTDRIRSSLSRTSSEFVIFHNSTNFSHPLPILFHSICDPDYTPYPRSHFYFTLLTNESIAKEAIASIVRITPVIYFIVNEDDMTCLFRRLLNYIF